MWGNGNNSEIYGNKFEIAGDKFSATGKIQYQGKIGIT